MSGRIVTIGEGLAVLRTSEIGSVAHLSNLIIGTGGAELNVAIGAARLGAPVAWFGRVGDDGFGRRITRELRAESVDVHAVTDPLLPTGLLTKETPSSGRTAISYYRRDSAGSRLSADDLDELGLELHAGDIVHLTGITPALSESARGAMRHVLDLAEQSGATISYDVNHRRRLWDRERAVPVHLEFVRRAQIVFAGDDEARLVTGRHDDDPRELADALRELGPDEAVVKLGASGAIARVGDDALRQPAIELSEVVDTVGAGDAFVAGYLSERLAGRSPAARLATAVRTGAAACLHPGDWEGAPTRADLEAVVGDDPVAR